MKENYDICLKATLRYEGGKVDNPKDPGGRTAYGVTQNTYNAWRAKHGLSQGIKAFRGVYGMIIAASATSQSPE